MLSARKPHFLEIFLPNLSSDRLKVPSKFNKHLEGKTSGTVSLTGPSGNSWHVDLIEHNSHLFLDGGWPAFVKDHSIQCGDSLVFRYDGNLEFSVQIFDQTSCEKEEAFYAQCGQELSDLSGNMVSDLSGISGKKRERESEAAFDSVFGEKKMREIWMAVQDSKAGNRERKLEYSINKGLEHNRNGYVNRACNKASERLIVLAMPSLANGQMMSTAIHSHMKTSKIHTHRKKNASKLKKACAKKKKTDAQKKTSITKFIEARTAHYFSSSFPYFVRVMKYSNVNDRASLKIPVRFSMEHFPNCRVKVILQNLNGDCWTLNAVPATKSHSVMHTLCGGWSAFVRGNGIKMEDVCIFELVDKLQMRVHILRLGLQGLHSETQNHSTDIVGSGGLPLETANNAAQDYEFHHPESLVEMDEADIYNNMDHRMELEMILGPQNFEQMDEPDIYCNVEHGKDLLMICGPQQEAASTSDTSDNDPLPATSPVYSASSPVSRTWNKSTECNADGTMSCHTSEKFEANLPTRRTLHMPRTAEDATAALSFTSPFPYFMKVMTSSNIGGSYTLGIPTKFSRAYLPSCRTKIVLRNVRGECWNVTSSRYGHQTKFYGGGWMSFVRSNGVNLADVCVFELLDERLLQVHVFEASERMLDRPSYDAADDDSTASVVSI